MSEDGKSIVNVSIDVPDLDSGVNFYCKVFGWSEKSRPFPGMAIIDGNNVTLCIHSKPEGSRPTPEQFTRQYKRHWTPVHLDIHVADFVATVHDAKAAGASVEQEFQEPMPTAFCCDPFGNGFCVIGK